MPQGSIAESQGNEIIDRGDGSFVAINKASLTQPPVLGPSGYQVKEIDGVLHVITPSEEEGGYA